MIHLSSEVQITVRYQSIDRFSKTAKFKTLAGARRFAQKWVGETPDISEYGYAVDAYGTGKVTCAGARILDLFPCCDEREACEACGACGVKLGDGITLDCDGAQCLSVGLDIAARVKANVAGQCAHLKARAPLARKGSTATCAPGEGYAYADDDDSIPF